MTRNIRVLLSEEARQRLSEGDGRTNRAGRTLRDWLVNTFETKTYKGLEQAHLFGATLVVDNDVPLLLEALTRVTQRKPDDLVEAWALEEPGPPREGEQSVSAVSSVHLPDDARGKITELLDLAETLFDETVTDGKRRLGDYPAAEEAGKSAREIYRALRKILDLPSE